MITNQSIWLLLDVWNIFNSIITIYYIYYKYTITIDILYEWHIYDYLTLLQQIMTLSSVNVNGSGSNGSDGSYGCLLLCLIWQFDLTIKPVSLLLHLVSLLTRTWSIICWRLEVIISIVKIYRWITAERFSHISTSFIAFQTASDSSANTFLFIFFSWIYYY